MSFVDKLDNYYNSRKPNEVWLMVILFSLLVGYLIYTLLSPISSGYREQQESINRDLKTKISSDNSFLKSITVNGDRDYMIKKLNKEIVEKRRDLNDYRAKLRKLDGAMKNLNGVLYTKDNWSKFLHNIASKAKDNNLKVFSITNIILDQNRTKKPEKTKAKTIKTAKTVSTSKTNNNFAKVLDIEIKCQGKYGEILSFMNDLEQTKLVANITQVKLTATNSDPKADIKLSVWGIKP